MALTLIGARVMQSPSAARSAGRVAAHRADGWGLSVDKHSSIDLNRLQVICLIDLPCGETPPVARSARHPPRAARGGGRSSDYPEGCFERPTR